MIPRTTLLALVTPLLAAGAGCSDDTTGPADRPATAVRVAAPDTGAYFGLFSIGDAPDGIAELTAKSGGVPPPLVFTFHDWNRAGITAPEPVLQTFADPLEGEHVQTTPLELARQLADQGSVLVMAWVAVDYLSEHPDYWTDGATHPITYGDILSGEYDEHLRTCARQIRDLGVPVMLSPFGEFNSVGFVSFGPQANQWVVDAAEQDPTGQYGDPAIPDGPERVRDVFRHVVDRFREEGADNVTWFFYSHSAYLNPDDLAPWELAVQDLLALEHYWPGEAYVDWVGGSAYLSATEPGRDLAFAVDHALAAFAALTDRPFFIPEFGITAPAGTSRVAEMERVFAHDLPARPRIAAFALADAPLFAEFFGIPRLGAGEGEVAAWRELVIGGDGYVRGPVLVRRGE
jgi:hypothetical protein